MDNSIEFVKWLQHTDNKTVHYNPHTQIYSESMGFSLWDCFINSTVSIEKLYEEFLKSNTSQYKIKKQTLVASMTILNDNVIYSKYAEILEIECDVIKNGNKQQWKMDKFSVIHFFYIINKMLIDSRLETKGIICHFNIKRYYDGIYGKTTLLSIPLERILIHLSKLNEESKVIYSRTEQFI